MDVYQEIMQDIRNLQRTSGGDIQDRIATAALVKASFHKEFERVRRGNREADVFEDVNRVTLTVNGRIFDVIRLSGQCEVETKLFGFSQPQESVRTQIPDMSFDEVRALVQKVVIRFLAALRDDIARRGM